MAHNGTNTTFSNYTGNLEISNNADDGDILFRCDDGSGGLATYMTIDGSATDIKVAKAMRFNDLVSATFGDGSDLRIAHDGFDSYVNNFTGNLNIVNLANDKDILFQSDDGSGGVTEYLKLDGGLTKTVFSKPSVWLDNQTVQFGNAADLQIQHNGTDSYIDNATGNLRITTYQADKDIIFSAEDGAGGTTPYLTLDGSAEQVVASKDIKLGDQLNLLLGNSADLQLRHTGSNSIIENYAGDLYIRNHVNDQDIIFQSDDGSGGLATYLTIDGDREEVVANKPLVQTPASSSDDPTNNGELIFTVASNTSIKVKYKGTDGQVRSTALTLS